MKQIISTPLAPAAIGTYSQAVKVDDTGYLSGQIPLDPVSMQLVAVFENQVRRVFEKRKAVCEAAGGALNELVKVNVFLIDLSNFAKVNEIMATYFAQPYPARAAVGVSALPRGAQVEIEGVMVLDSSAQSNG